MLSNLPQTGLYSAVLTAFVIVSYPQLQEDTAGETLQVLRLIAAQTATYTILDGRFASSTAVIPTTTAPFQPSTSAIRQRTLVCQPCDKLGCRVPFDRSEAVA